MIKLRDHTRTWVEQDKAICSDKVDTTSSSFAAEQEYKFLAIRIVELVDKLLTLIDSHCAIQTEVAISICVNIDCKRS